VAASLTLERVSKLWPHEYGSVHDLSLTVGDGETCVLVGPSGCGKTTTLRLINRLVEPTSGRILLNGEDVTRLDPVQLRRRMGYVIQHVGLFPHLTVGDNIATVPRLLGWDRERTRHRVRELLELIGLDPTRFTKLFPNELSGGQQQLVGVGRALGADPPVLLMDEPFGAIDRVTRDRVQTEFLRIQARMRKIVVLVTHDIDEAVRLGDRIAIMSTGGILEQYDSPGRVLHEPANEFVSDFLGPHRGQKRLAVLRIDPARLEQAAPDARAASVPVTATLADALSAMLLSDTDRVVVTRDGRALGALTLHGLLRTADDAGDAKLRL
jgi:osmoprotectant transport system ATP-binding protein